MISSVGFPIVAFLMMFKLHCSSLDTISKNTDALNRLREYLIKKP